MKAIQYFQQRDLCLEALDKYRGYKSNWPISDKQRLYSCASHAFDFSFRLTQRQAEFDKVYDDLKGWHIDRNGEMASSQSVFGVLDSCPELHCDSPVTLMNFSCDDLDQIAKTLVLCQGFKKQPKGTFPFMAVSKILHTCNPKLFTIYDNQEIDNGSTGVYKAFGQEWKPFYDRLKGTYSASVPTGMVFMFEWSLSYLHWASHLMQNSYDGLMEDFAGWARSEDGLQATDSRSVDLNQCYATALDCIIIGAKYLELGK